MDEQISPEAQTAGKPTAPGPSRARPASRKHMGVATSDPTYLQPQRTPTRPQRSRSRAKDHVRQWRVRADRRRRAAFRRLHSPQQPHAASPHE